MEISESFIQVISLFFANFAIILWFRAEARADWRKMDTEMKEFRELWMKESKDFNERWMQESKDFHKRLCEIEASKK